MSPGRKSCVNTRFVKLRWEEEIKIAANPAAQRRHEVSAARERRYETRLVVASVEQNRKNERRRRGLMTAQHAAESGVLGTVGKNASGTTLFRNGLFRPALPELQSLNSS